MVKSADTADLKSADPYQVVGVQVPLRAPYKTILMNYILEKDSLTPRDSFRALKELVHVGVLL